MGYKIGIADLSGKQGDLSWTDKIDNADGVIVVTEEVPSPLCAKVVEHKGKLIVHILCPINGAGPVDVRTLYKQTADLVAAGFPKSQVVVRVDVPLPATEKLDRIYSTIEAFVAGGYSRYRVNILNMQTLGQEGLVPVGMSLPAQLAEVDNMLSDVRKSWAYLGRPAGDLRIESGADSGLRGVTKCGSPSRYDLMLLGLSTDDAATPLSWRSEVSSGTKKAAKKASAAAKKAGIKAKAGGRAVGTFLGRQVTKACRGSKTALLGLVGLIAAGIRGLGRLGRRFLNGCRRCAVAVLRKWKWIAGVFAALIVLYCIAIYSSIPFIQHYRTLYIETAMSTMNHQWVATSFIPQSVIDEVMENARKQMEESVVPSSTPPETKREKPEEEVVSPQEAAKLAFAEKYSEINMDTMPEDTDYLTGFQMADVVDKGIKTTAGDSIWAIDTINNLLIVQVSGDGYSGKLAIIKDSSQVKLAVNTRRDRGMTVTELCDTSGAVLGINGNAFEDPSGRGSGVTPVGLIISDGQKLHDAYGAYNYQVAGFDNNNVFRVGKDVDASILRDALQFYPITVLDGEKHVDGSLGMGIQPRSSIGQTKDGSTLLLIIDGRQVHSLGITVSGCADILLRYGCQNAMNLDGGSSASMSYMGEMITKTSSPQAGGRWLPSAWVVMSPVDKGETAD